MLARVLPSIATVLMLTVLPSSAAALDPAWGIPPDGFAGPVRSLTAIRTWVPVWTEVTTEVVKVVAVSCPNCEDATTAADFWVSDGSDHRVRVHVMNTWQPSFNVKKQEFVPQVGFNVVVQGRLQTAGSERYIEMKRFGERDHTGPTVHAYDVAKGKYHTGQYVWLDPVTVLNVARWNDGDTTYDVRDPRGGGVVHIEATPPFMGLRVPNKGETVTPYGMLRIDPDHGFWEMHPVRCWSHTDCVPLSYPFLRNGLPAGTPSGAGYYLQGGPVPLFLPLAK